MNKFLNAENRKSNDSIIKNNKKRSKKQIKEISFLHERDSIPIINTNRVN